MHKYFSHSDLELCSLLKQGDKEAFNLIYERYWEKLYKQGNRLLHLTAQAEDIVQDIFVNLWIKRAEYEIENLQAYLHAALRSRVLNYIKRDQGKEIFFEPFQQIQQASFSAEELIRQKEFLHVISLYINALPAKRKEIFLLYYQQKMSTEDIAAFLGISQKTVQNQLNTAMHGLRNSLTSLLILAFISQS